MIYTDSHMHTSYSSDSPTPMRDMIEGSIARGLKTICFTEHMDMDYPDKAEFHLDTPAYLEGFQKLKEEYRGRIEMLFGVELGIQPHLANRLREYTAQYPFEFIIGSTHVIDGIDPYYPGYFETHTETEGYRRYFEITLENLNAFDQINTFGHLDYIVRYGPNQNKYYTYRQYADVIDEILKLLVHKGIALEINSGGYKYGLGNANPHRDILKRYREMGGELITIGADAHAPEHIAYDFDKVYTDLTSCGFRYYTFFRKRKPEFIKL